MKIRRIIMMLSICLLAFLVSACSKQEPDVKEGTVINKEFKAAESKVEVKSVYKKGREKIERWYYSYPDRYIITIKDNEDASKTQVFYVTKEVYDKTELNANFVYDENTCKIIEPYSKTKQ